ncbi:hypothetical protein [Secundilactobacillus similis]|uniref:hypothetical protein n=1 Tax=Secundilactobacillus similis TaxID=414682 RepID=UPI000A6299EA|nr:hypothetical protein [Secundilactobacillus similis]
MVSEIVDDVTKKGQTKPCCRSYKILELSPDGQNLRFWISNALDVTNHMLWSDEALFDDIVKNVGPVPPVSLIGGEDAELVREIFIPSWDIYCQWQADCLEYLLQHHQYDAIFSHLHNVDCAGHQLWHLGKTLALGKIPMKKSTNSSLNGSSNRLTTTLVDSCTSWMKDTQFSLFPITVCWSVKTYRQFWVSTAV